MTTDEPHDLERAARAPLVGVDGEGAEHRFDRHRDTVYVFRDGDLEHVEELGPGELSAWVDYVGAERGWQDCRYVSDGFAALARYLATRLGA